MKKLKEAIKEKVEKEGLSNLTKPDEAEPYILTPSDEEIVVQHEIRRAQEHFAWRLKDKLGLKDYDIVSRISQINWDERIDRDRVLKIANSNKIQDLWHKEQRENEKKAKIEGAKKLAEECDAKYFFKLMSYNSRNTYETQLIVNDDTKKLITVICFFFGNDPRFETELGFDFKKGLLLRGISGLGKTYLIKCISDNKVKPVSLYSTININEEISANGYFELNPSSVCYLDDVGTEEPVVNYFGTKISFVKNFIELYYTNNKPFNRLIISTNDSFDKLEGKYGFRVRSRIKDMFNIIDVTGVDLRGKRK